MPGKLKLIPVSEVLQPLPCQVEGGRQYQEQRSMTVTLSDRCCWMVVECGSLYRFNGATEAAGAKPVAQGLE